MDLVQGYPGLLRRLWAMLWAEMVVGVEVGWEVRVIWLLRQNRSEVLVLIRS